MWPATDKPRKGRLMPALLFVLGGCAGIPDAVRELPPTAGNVELVTVPFHPQDRFQCGPAALTTVLEASGAEVALGDITRKVYLPGRKGSLQLEMVAATRTSGRVPYLVDGSLSALAAELHAGRPVVVLQNLGIAAIPRWHYAVVVGIDVDNDAVILRSGTERRRETPTGVFLRTWSRSGFWGLVALVPGRLPANVDRERYFGAVAGLEQAGMSRQAALGWEAALQRWPRHPTALFGLANAHLSLGNNAAAERGYRDLLEQAPGLAAARNNLAFALAHQGYYDEALEQVEQAIATNDDAALRSLLEETLREIGAMRD